MSQFATFTWTVMNIPPAVTPIPNQLSRGNVSVPMLYVSASDANGDALAYAATNLPPALAIHSSMGTITGQTPSVDATYPVVVTVADGHGGRTETSFTWTIDANMPPVCSTARPSIVSISRSTGKFVSVNLLAVTDPNGAPLTITITRILQDEPTSTAQPQVDGMGLGTSVAQIRTQVTDKSGRIYDIRFTAADGLGGSCSGR